VKALLDTCVFLWLLTGERTLPERVTSGLTNEDLWLSVASVWEISVKFAKGTLRLPVPPGRMVADARKRYAISSLPVDEESALHLVKLPRLHPDPFDRMLVSQAIVHGMTIITPDPQIAQYPARTIW
jgi:PIN domain nuclease of toxin-antitoxin system